MHYFEYEEPPEALYEPDQQWIETSRYYHRKGEPIPLSFVEIEDPRTSEGVSVPGLLILLGFIGTGFLLVILWPYRFLVLHLLIGLFALLVIVVWLIVVLKVRRRMRQRAELCAHPQVHNALEDEASDHEAYRAMPSFSDFLYPYDYRRNKRPSEQLEPDQRSRF